MGNQKITGLATATLGTEAVNLTQLNSAFSGYDRTTTLDGRYYSNTTPLNAIALPGGTVSLNNQRISGLAAPSGNTDATNKAYVDALVASSGGGGSGGSA